MILKPVQKGITEMLLSGFTLFSSENFVLIDATILLPGMLLLILSSLIKAGFEQQKEINEIL